MKTRHIIAIGLLSATAIGILAIGINTKKAKQTKAESLNDIVISNDELKKIEISNEIEFYTPETYNINKITTNNKITQINTNETNIQTDITTHKIENKETTASNRLDITIAKNITNIKTLTLTLVEQIITTADYTIAINQKITYTDNTTKNDLITIFKRWNENVTNTSQNLNYNLQITNIQNYTYNIEHTYSYGQTTGYTTGETAGYQTGYTEGETAGYQTGYTAGVEYANGQHATDYSQGYVDGHENGYAEGWNDSDAFNHPIAIQPLMLNILTMPFTFISQAFDVTLWPGTAYEFNFSNFIKGLIAIATILFIIKLFTSGFAVIGNYSGKISNNKLNNSKTKLNEAKTNQANRTNPNNKTNTNININKKG